ncbi:life-span regulatory factor domain-containing protein [Ophiocordyceps camponoti-floridani]|uniref:Life-span regulatory factor domain-containing protein n=1 Tax=Ophiocordyceps camponoti-floridani TaxID=2030778 RepID=A0A8H4Q1K7_9HYPO|nr:life-span regulatory factor domain-containing protein [Ophiocordyceps camponoti-floridani]
MLHHRKTDGRRSAPAPDPVRQRRPGLSRRQTPANAQLLGRSHRDRDRDGWHDERESFPQFCMGCEKQFVPHNERFLYCSDTCRRIDQNSTSTGAPPATSRLGDLAGQPEPRDIIPRATPSRPTSIRLSNSPPGSPGSKSHHSSAISALRSLNLGPSSPPSPTWSNAGTMWPFGRTVAASPGTSYTRPSAAYLSSAMDPDSSPDRPLPPRRPTVHSRPKSIELVTPVLGR